ncbi:MAG: outer membrane lipoprotein carrier protein LolA, partial [Alphaproteobacteria bacterium]|nr:outer membrane lipoprotein carrier protein LolA [Alphaproteobacteria bacterium]
MKKIFLALFMCVISLNSFAGIDKNLIVSAEKYLNSITGLKGDFVQVAKNNKQYGVFSMLRPGRIRLDYKDAPIQLISDGKDLYFFDKSLDQITTVPLTSTPAGILVRQKIDLQNSDINVSETQDGKNTFSLKMNMKDQEGLGYMTVVFDKMPVKLNSWVVVDATNTKTEVSFNNLKTKTDFDKE